MTHSSWLAGPVAKWRAFEERGKTARVSKAVAAGGLYAVFAGLAGLTGVVIVVGCGLFAFGGFVAPVRNQRSYEGLSLIMMATLWIVGAVPFFYNPFDQSTKAPGAKPVTVVDAHNPLLFSAKEIGTLDGSVAVPETGSSSQNVSTQAEAARLRNGVKVGSRVIRLTVTNDSSTKIELLDLVIANFRVSAPVNGTLYYYPGQGGDPNDLLGVDLGAGQPVFRHMTADGKFANPFFADTHITIAGHDSEVLILTIHADAPKLYRWQLNAEYDSGYSEPQTVKVDIPRQFMEMTGYARDYKQVYGVVNRTHASGFCSKMVGTDCVPGD